MKIIRIFLVSTILFLQATKIVEATPNKTLARPNIVFILADDLGYGDLGCYGHPYAKTPAIDKLAKEGTIFESFYASGVTSSPSRTAFMTGSYPATLKDLPKDHGLADNQTITKFLKDNGYKTGHFGKWHLGPNDTSGTYGIDEISETIDKVSKMKVVQNDTRGRDAVIVDKALKFIENNKNNPFYVNIWTLTSHHPVGAVKGLKNEFPHLNIDPSDFPRYMQVKLQEMESVYGPLDSRMQIYLSEIYALDQQVKRVLDKIDQLDLRNNTIVVFASDQGANGSTSLQPETAKKLNKNIKNKKEKKGFTSARTDLLGNLLGYNGPFRGGKHNYYEGGVRIPFIIRWPNKVPAGVRNSSIIAAVDWLPTLCHIAGAKYNPKKIDGENVSAAWFGANQDRSKPLFWKVESLKKDSAVRFGRWKYIVNSDGGGELYDLYKDPQEMTNVSKDNPEAASQMHEILREWVDSLPVKNGGKK